MVQQVSPSASKETAMEAKAAACAIEQPTGVVIIGAGERGVYFIGMRMVELAEETGLRIIGVYDRLQERAVAAAADLSNAYRNQSAGKVAHTVESFATQDEAINDPRVAFVLVTTHTNAHRIPVEAAVRGGKRVYLDKPIAVNLSDAQAIARLDSEQNPILMGFTRRYEQPWVQAISLAQGGAIGSLHMVLLRSVIPYSRYLQLWHRQQAASGGALNDKGSHHFDVLNWIAGAEAVCVTAQGGRSNIFAPDPTAPARCSLCDRTCAYRRHETLVDKYEGAGQVPNASWLSAERSEDWNDACVYRPGADIDDHAIVTVRYENGITACLFFSIFGPWSQDQETLEIVGSSGRIRMERHSGQIDMVSEHGHRREIIAAGAADRESSHYGADLELVRTMQRFCTGERPLVGPREGLASLRLVQAAQCSLRQGGVPVDPRALTAAQEADAA